MAHEKLKEIYKQARCLRMSTNDFALEDWEIKFAEAIVRDCATLVNKNDFEGSKLGDSLLFEHFGLGK
jgi:hypothetical protein